MRGLPSVAANAYLQLHVPEGESLNNFSVCIYPSPRRASAFMNSEHASQDGVIKVIENKNIKIVNFCHIPEDCRLRTLSFAVREKRQLEEMLYLGERVDGSSLFSYIEASSSDIYIVPNPDSFFIDPFSPIPALDIMCTYVDENGKPLSIAPQAILSKAEDTLRSTAGVSLKALAELEFYVQSQEERAPPVVRRKNNYHETTPLAVFTQLRNEALVTLEELGVGTKYGHAEVGRFHTRTGRLMEQHEIELLPRRLGKAAEATVIAIWVLRNLSRKFGATVSFSPKPTPEHAGSGMHLHLCGLKDGRNIFAKDNGELTAEAKQAIGGVLKFAPSLAAWGNTNPVSYLRFLFRSESPMNVSWGTRNRAALIRIPLWWSFKENQKRAPCRRTIEFRAPDASANTYLLLAGIALAVEYGLRHPKEALAIAEALNADPLGSSGQYPALPLSWQCDCPRP